MGLGQLAIRPDAPGLVRHGLLIGPGGIGVGDHEVGLDLLARLEFHPGDAASLAEDLSHICPLPYRPALALEQAHHCSHNRPGAAHCGMHPKLPLEREDEAVDLGDLEWVSANQEGMKAKDLLEFRAFKMALGHLINALPGSHLNHGRHGGKQRTKGLEGDGAKVDIAKLVAEVGITGLDFIGLIIFCFFINWVHTGTINV